MEMDLGKLFVGGISWETNEDHLREYFQAFGEVVEAVVMRDRTTGRSRGFGFVVFANASAAERVVRGRHIINGRTVEAKKAVPRDEHQNPNRNMGSIQGSPGPARTKKIFVGGLASAVTESDFKAYFEQFGTITDVVVMYDHNTQRPRGFGFITFDSEEAVDKVLVRTFHELHGKMVEVKRAVPKELSPGPTRSPSNSVLNRANNFLNAYAHQGYIANTLGGHGARTDGQFSPVISLHRNGCSYPSYNLSNQSIGLNNMDYGFSLNYSPVGDSGLGYGHGMNSYFSENSGKYESLLSSGNRNVWGNENPSYGANSLTANDFGSSRIGNNTGGFGHIGDNMWGRSLISSIGDTGNNVYAQGDSIVGGRAEYARKNGGTVGTTLSSYTSTNNLHGNDSFYSGDAWHMLSPEAERFTSFGYGRGNAAAADVMTDDLVGYAGNYGVAARSNKGIAA